MSRGGPKGENMTTEYKLRVRTPTQKEIFEKELRSQLSDGCFENDDTDERLWNCEVLVAANGEKLGPNFSVSKRVDFNDDLLIEVVSDRMISYAKKVDPLYDMEKLISDLDDITNIVSGIAE